MEKGEILSIAQSDRAKAAYYRELAKLKPLSKNTSIAMAMILEQNAEELEKLAETL